MNADPGLAMQRPAQSDTIPILNARMICASPSVAHVIRGGIQTRKASNIVVQAGGLPSFAPPRPHHRRRHPATSDEATRLTVSHGITGICEVVWGKGNALCRAGKLVEKAKSYRTLYISTVAYVTGVISVITRKLYDICSRMCLYVTELQLF
jgi:hypothetical protein